MTAPAVSSRPRRRAGGLPVAEGHVDYRGWRTWYRVVGDLSAGSPLVLLHGGPGSPSDKFSVLEGLARPHRPVVLYDQIGCGRSDRPDDPSLWTVEFFLGELAALRRSLGLSRVHLFGSSWGGMLALEHVLSGADGVVSMVLSSTPASIPLWIAELRRLRDDMAPAIRRLLEQFEAEHDPTAASAGPSSPRSMGPWGLRPHLLRLAWAACTTRPAGALAGVLGGRGATRPFAYQLAELAFLRKHGCRKAVPPLGLFESMCGKGRQTYEVMWGPSDVHGTGLLCDWDVTGRLGGVRVPTLITSGRYDEATPAQTELLLAIPGSRHVLFESSSHLAFLEEPDRFIDVVDGFLSTWEGPDA